MEKMINTPGAMEALGAELAAICQTPCVIYLVGELGAGKTTFVRGFLHYLGHHGIVKSPTYTVVEPYQFNEIRVFHFDLYRLTDASELDFIGIHDYFAKDTICLIEWPERGEKILPKADLVCRISYCANGRLVEIEPTSPDSFLTLMK
jgi:tRNA threonylcarbamoyladenosine biosynthesis protein TsaE